MLENGA